MLSVQHKVRIGRYVYRILYVHTKKLLTRETRAFGALMKLKPLTFDFESGSLLIDLIGGAANLNCF